MGKEYIGIVGSVFELFNVLRKIILVVNGIYCEKDLSLIYVYLMLIMYKM